MSCLAVSIPAYVLAMATTDTAPRYVAMMLMPSVCSGPQIMLYKTLNLHMARPYPKRAAGTAMINAIGGLSNIWTAYLYYSAPRYYAAFGCRKSPLPVFEQISWENSPDTRFTVLACTACFALVITGYLIHVRRLNTLLGGSEEDQQKAKKSGVTQQQVDLNWRYIGY